MSHICRNPSCHQPFEVTSADLAFYEKVSPLFNGRKELIPPPTLCPDCRRQRRHSHRNERNLYHRKCDFSGQQILSVFAPERPAQVYLQSHWWSDAWDPQSYGRPFDFNRSFFDQFAELQKVVPQVNVTATNAENSEYCHLIADCKNCYLVFESSHAQDCLHGYWLQKCTDCVDVSFSHECERCYQIDNCYNCQNLRYSRNATNCSDSAFLLDCIGCRNCLMCVNLRQKECCIENVQYSEEEYRAKLASWNLGSQNTIAQLQKRFNDFALTQPRKYMCSVNDENCTGNYIQDSKNCVACFHAHQAEDCKYGEHVWRGAKDGMDVVTFGRDSSLMYETTNTALNATRNLFCIQCWNSSDSLYSSCCFSCDHCFGCTSLKRASYYVLNQQYTKEEYEELVPRIIEHMRSRGEWGEHFPSTISLFSYNESVAQEYFPLTREEVLARGWRWSEELHDTQQYLGPDAEIPDVIDDVDDTMTKKILRCEVTGKPYKIIPQELAFYREMKIPIPRTCPDQRHHERMANRNPCKLWERMCMKCGGTIETSYASERSEIVYCESCYLASVY